MLHALLPGLLALAPPVQDADPLPLELGVPQEGRLDVTRSAPGVAEYVLDVPEDARFLTVELACGVTDLDLTVSRRVGPKVDPESLSSNLVEVDRVYLSRWTFPALRKGRYDVLVEYPYGEPPRWRGKWLRSVDYTLKADVVHARVDAVLWAGEPMAGQLDLASGRFRTYAVDVPEGAPALRVDLTDTPVDLDLIARPHEPIRSDRQVTHRAETYYGSETLLITRESQPALVPGRWYVEVIDLGPAEAPPAPFTIRCSFAAEPPAELLVVTPLRRPREGHVLDPALCSTVNLYVEGGWGSGTILTPDGLVLTAAHVLVDYAQRPLDDLVIAIPESSGRPPVERFRARVVRFDAGLDLALVQIDRGFYGQALPEGFAFPVVPLGRSEALEIGDPLWACGYPSIGGAGTRYPITVTRGVVSGFEDTGTERWIRTDAEIAEGSSGGPLLDGDGRLVGVLTSIVDDQAAQLSFALPYSALPEAWRAEVEGRRH